MRYRTYFSEENAKILYTDALKTTMIEDNSIDLIVTSPPYNLDINYKSCDDNQPYDEYLKFTKKWLRRAYKWLKPDGKNVFEHSFGQEQRWTSKCRS